MKTFFKNRLIDNLKILSFFIKFFSTFLTKNMLIIYKNMIFKTIRFLSKKCQFYNSLKIKEKVFYEKIFFLIL